MGNNPQYLPHSSMHPTPSLYIYKEKKKLIFFLEKSQLQNSARYYKHFLLKVLTVQQILKKIKPNNQTLATSSWGHNYNYICYINYFVSYHSYVMVLWYTFLIVYQTTSDHQPLAVFVFPKFIQRNTKKQIENKSKRTPVIYSIGPFDGSGDWTGRRSEAESDSIVDAPMEPNLPTHLFSFQAHITNRHTTSSTFFFHHTVFSR